MQLIYQLFAAPQAVWLEAVAAPEAVWLDAVAAPQAVWLDAVAKVMGHLLPLFIIFFLSNKHYN